MYIINPNIGGDEEYTAFVERTTGLLTSHGAVLVEGEPSPIGGRRKLAYPIHTDGQDVTEGFYVVTRFESEASQLGPIERDLKLSEPIIRYLLIKAEEEKPESA
jgi:small subunit ribosomal protein S6